jgi:hypothetical protein
MPYGIGKSIINHTFTYMTVRRELKEQLNALYSILKRLVHSSNANHDQFHLGFDVMYSRLRQTN